MLLPKLQGNKETFGCVRSARHLGASDINLESVFTPFYHDDP